LTRAENARQFDTNLAFQQSEAERNQQNTLWNQAFQTQQYADSRADTAWNQAFQTQQYTDSRADTAWEQDFRQQQLQLQQEQWKEQFEYSKMSDTQKMAYNYLMAAAENGSDVSDALLQQAGISRADYNAMKRQVSSGSSGGTTTRPGPDTNDIPAGDTDDSLLGDLDNDRLMAPATGGSSYFTANKNKVTRQTR